MDGFEKKDDILAQASDAAETVQDTVNAAADGVEAAAQNVSAAADEAAQAMTETAQKATSYEEVYGTPVQHTSSSGQFSAGGATVQYSVDVDNDADAPKANGLQIAGLVLGIISIVICCCSWVACIFGIAGIVLSVIGNKENKNNIGKAGLICSIVGTALGAIIFVVALAIGGSSQAILEQLQESGYMY